MQESHQQQRTVKHYQLDADRAPQSTPPAHFTSASVCVHSLCFLLSLWDQSPNRPRRFAKADNALVVLRMAGPEGSTDDEAFALPFAVAALGPALVDLAERGR